MLLLTADQVEYCKVQPRDLSCEQVFSGVIYQDRIYTLERSFPKAEKNYALQLARQQYLDHKGSVAILVIAETERYTIWSQNTAVVLQEPETAANCLIEQIDLADFVARMRNSGGLRLKSEPIG
jgi:hypothetical protein